MGRNDPDGGPGLRYTVLVPSVDTDGNDVAGVRAPMVGAPLGTYTGWNPRARGYGHGVQWRFEGSYIPFPDTPSERAGDGRSAAARFRNGIRTGRLIMAAIVARGAGPGRCGPDAGGGCRALRIRRGSRWNPARHTVSLNQPMGGHHDQGAGLLTRKHGISHEEFVRHWFDIHGPLAHRRAGYSALCPIAHH